MYLLKILTISLVFFAANQAVAQRKVSLKAPLFSDEDIIGSNAGIRPFRKGGINLETQYLQGRTIYHNYGHGGAGATLAYGTAKHVVDRFLAENKQANFPVAVLGSGYMGLMTANLLADQGYKVTIYADLFPQQKLQIQTLCLTSLIAGGLWMPFGIDAQNRTLFDEVTKVSFDYYKAAIEQKTFRGLKFAKVYSLGKAPDYRSQLPEGTMEEAEPVEIEFGNGNYISAYETTTILLDGYVFLNELFENAKRKGVVIVQRHFSTQDDLLALEEKVLFNALGFGSKQLFNDHHMMGIRGHHLYLKPQKDVDYFIFSSVANATISLYPSEYKVATGFSYEKNQEDAIVDPMKIERTKAEIREFFKDKVHAPAACGVGLGEDLSERGG